MHILAIGQSNIASHGDSRDKCDFGNVYHNGELLPLSDPIPGGSGEGGSVWTRLALLFRNSNLIEDIVISLRAQGGTSIADWSEGGRCFMALQRDIPLLKECSIPVTHIVYHQGERDTLLKTSEEQYIKQFSALYYSLVRYFPVANWIICRASYRMGVVSEPIRQAQCKIAAEFSGCIPGPDTDKFGAEYRYDNTHFNDLGLNAFARELADCLHMSFETGSTQQGSKNHKTG